MKGVTAIDVMFDYEHNLITLAPSDYISEVHCNSSVLPVNMKGVTAIDVMLCLTINPITLLWPQVIMLVKSTVIVVSYQLT